MSKQSKETKQSPVTKHLCALNLTHESQALLKNLKDKILRQGAFRPQA